MPQNNLTVFQHGIPNQQNTLLVHQHGALSYTWSYQHTSRPTQLIPHPLAAAGKQTLGTMLGFYSPKESVTGYIQSLPPNNIIINTICSNSIA